MSSVKDPRGRKPKPPGEKHVRILVTFPPGVGKRLLERFPPKGREKSNFIARVVEKALDEGVE